MMWSKRLTLSVLLASSLSHEACADGVSELYASAASKYGLDVKLVAAIGALESNHSPYALNIDDESFFPSTPAAAENVVVTVSENPWVVHIHTPDSQGVLRHRRAFFPSREEALSWLTAAQHNRHQWLLPKAKVSSDRENSRKADRAVIRTVDIRNTGMGLMQINYRYHGKHGRFSDWLDPSFNVDYAAKFLRELMDQHGSVERAVAYYCCGGRGAFQHTYIERFHAAYSTQ